MEKQRIIYTDGRQVVVTRLGIRVKDTLYRMRGVTQYGLSILGPGKFPSWFLIGLGLTVSVLSSFNLLPPTLLKGVVIGGIFLTGETASLISLFIGLAITAAGIAIGLMGKQRYAVRIVTAFGKKDVIVSKSKKYISQIVDAMDEAIAA